MEEADVGAEKEDEYINGGTSSEDDTEFPAQKKKKTVCYWLREFPQVWNTRHENYRKTPEKDLLWEEQGQKMGLTGSHLKQWYRSTRFKFGHVKTKKGKSGSVAQPVLTFRDKTVWQLFQFLGDFVKEKANREPVASLRKRIAAQAPAHTPPRDPSPVRDEEPAPRPRGAAPPPPAAEAPDAAPVDPLVDLHRQGIQLLVSHRAALDAVIGIKGPHKDRSAYCDYLNQCGQQLNQELWSRFKRESFMFMESLLE
ncbi:hypothetical protein MAR_018319 [Mya arenaria]|uniref:MADF domain-containing protein n=1 Tax=Mya arenaria TaxID=6604 RepID=A0ABY7EHT7_MYAAR|nr:uncharacterized protein LOC128236427 [Mya arenaria]WAR08361.1 hypothetical protein MAR_018319 [Mya arenaria]